VCILNQSAAAFFFPHEQALGRYMRSKDSNEFPDPVARRVIGLAEDAKFSDIREGPPDHLPALIDSTDRQSGELSVLDTLADKGSGHRGFSQDAFGDCANGAVGDLRYAARTNGRCVGESGINHPTREFLRRVGIAPERTRAIWAALGRPGATDQRDRGTRGTGRDERDGAADGLKGSTQVARLGTPVGGNGTLLHNAAPWCFGLRSLHARRRGGNSGGRNDSGGDGARATRRHIGPRGQSRFAVAAVG